MVDNPRYSQDREAALAALDPGTIDEPIVGIITARQDVAPVLQPPAVLRSEHYRRTKMSSG